MKQKTNNVLLKYGRYFLLTSFLFFDIIYYVQLLFWTNLKQAAAITTNDKEAFDYFFEELENY